MINNQLNINQINYKIQLIKPKILLIIIIIIITITITILTIHKKKKKISNNLTKF